MERNLVFYAHLGSTKGPNKRTLSNHVIPRPREGSRTCPFTSFADVPHPPRAIRLTHKGLLLASL